MMISSARWLAVTLLASCMVFGCAGTSSSRRADAGERALATSGADTTVILVRHAERVDDSDDSAINDAGFRRATWLESVVHDAGVDTVLVSNRQRTHQTAREVLRELGLRKNPDGDFSHDDTAAAVADKIRGVGPGHVILVVAHSHQLPDILKELGGWTVPRISDFDRVFVVTLGADGRKRLIRAGYPPAPQGEAATPARP